MIKILAAALILGIASAAPAGAAENSGSPCRGAPPRPGVVFRGPVLHVVDGETLCVARGPSPTHWSEFKLLDPPAGRSRQVLMEVAFAQDVDCTVLDVARSPALATCTVAGRSLAARAREPRTQRRALAWR